MGRGKQPRTKGTMGKSDKKKPDSVTNKKKSESDSDSSRKTPKDRPKNKLVLKVGRLS